MPFFKIQIPEKGNRFLPVTLLSQRYNIVWMNGGAVPSSEADPGHSPSISSQVRRLITLPS